MKELTARVRYKGQLSTECEHILSGDQLSTDAPKDNNGNGQAFSPTDLTATSLASCMLTVMGIRAAQSGIRFEKVYAGVQKVMNEKPRRIAEINIVVTVDESWTSSEKRLLEQVGKTCPVALSLHPDIGQNITFEYTKE